MHFTPTTPLLLIALLTSSAQAKVDADEAAKLGNELTPVGAIAGPNEDGTVPKWIGPRIWSTAAKNITQEELERLRKKSPEEIRSLLTANLPAAPLFTITRENLDEYEDRITDGHKAMFERFPNYRMIISKAVRGAFFPQEIYDATRVNATSAYLQGQNSVMDAKLGFPFPIPQNGEEAIWNHKLKFRGSTYRTISNKAIVREDGNFTIAKSIFDIKFYYANLKEPAESKENLMFKLVAETLAPRRVAGQRALVIEKIDETDGGRNVWIYNEGVGKPKRIPKAGYDTPLPDSDGEQFADQADMFNGGLDYYNWELKGREERYIAYNSFELNSPLHNYKDILQKGFINRDLARYELHRVWIVEAELKEGVQHQIKKRVFYIDEDSWSIAAVECYDNRDELWKLQEAHLLTAAFIPTVTGVPDVIYDLQSGRYFANGLTNEEKIGNWTLEFRESHFTERALTRRGLFR